MRTHREAEAERAELARLGIGLCTKAIRGAAMGGSRWRTGAG